MVYLRQYNAYCVLLPLEVNLADYSYMFPLSQHRNMFPRNNQSRNMYTEKKHTSLILITFKGICQIFRLFLKNYMSGVTTYVLIVATLCFMAIIMDKINRHPRASFLFRIFFNCECSVCTDLKFPLSSFAIMFQLILVLSILYVPVFFFFFKSMLL